MEYKNTINSILKRLEKEFEIVSENDIAETMETEFILKDCKNNVIINENCFTIPLAASAETKKMFKEENSPALECYRETERGDILLVKDIENNKILVENISLKEEYRKNFYVDKTDIITKKYNVVKRKTVGLLKALQNLSEIQEEEYQ